MTPPTTWVAFYADGRTVSFDDAGSFANLDPRDLGALRVDFADGRPPVVIDLRDGATPVFFWRHEIVLNMQTGAQEHTGTTTVAGFRRADGSGVYLHIVPDGGIVLSDRLTEMTAELAAVA